jgi:hypothetical protein
MTFLPRLLALLAVGAGFAPGAFAAQSSPQDLGQGLNYFRVHALADDAKALEAAVAGNAALVIDVRFASARPEDVALFEHALAQHHGAELLCVLVSPATPAAFAAALADGTGRFTTLGVSGAAPSPKVVVEQAAETDRRAYDALDAGTPLAALLSGKIEKDRYDEAALMNDFSNGNTSGEPPPAPDPKTIKDAPEKPPVLIDRVLQRAVHLHRALAAIKSRS